MILKREMPLKLFQSLLSPFFMYRVMILASLVSCEWNTTFTRLLGKGVV